MLREATNYAIQAAAEGMQVMPAPPEGIKPPVYKTGDIVRVFRDPQQHGVKFGALMRVARSGLLPFEGYAEEVDLVPLHTVPTEPSGSGPIMGGGWNQNGQSVDVKYIKLAKQAMLTEEAARLVRMGNLPKRSNKTPLANRMRLVYAYSARRA
jgi:hypothetical protein